MSLPFPHNLGRTSALRLAGLGLLVAACAPHAATPAAPEAPPPTTRPVVRLAADDEQSLAALLRMEDARSFDAALVQRLLQDDHPEVRGRAVLAAARVRDPRALPYLLHAAQDADISVRTRAAFGLGLLGDTAQAVIEALTQAALTGAAPVAAEAVAALGRLGVERSRPALDSILANPAAPAAVRHEALLAAWRLPRNAGTTSTLTRWAGHPDAESRWRAVYSLARTPDPAAVPLYLSVINDPDERVRANAARGLRAAVADTAGRREQALLALAAAVEDPHPHVRINALRNLVAFRENARTTPLLVARLREEDANVATAAAQALAETGDRAASGALAEVAANAARPLGLRAAALVAWTRVDPAAAAPVAATWADSSDWLVRLNAARALSAAPWHAAAAPVERLARDRHPVVAAEALNAARTAGDTVPATRRVFVEALGAADPIVRAAAARGLGRDAGIADLDLLLQAWQAARNDAARDAAIAVLEALGRLAEQGIPVDRTFFLRHGQAGPPADPAVHRAVIQHVGPTPPAWGEPRTAPEPRPMAFYVDVIRRLVSPVLAGAESPVVAIETPHGDIVLTLAAADAPLTVLNFLQLVERGYYTGTRWHRVVPNFVIQDGDPRGDGLGGPGHAIRDEINTLRYGRGTLGMALAGPDTGGSQFFVTHAPQPHLDGGYTIFGAVYSGMEAVDAVVQDEPILGFRRIR